jgi:hypothetical protein
MDTKAIVLNDFKESNNQIDNVFYNKVINNVTDIIVSDNINIVQKELKNDEFLC